MVVSEGVKSKLWDPVSLQRQDPNQSPGDGESFVDTLRGFVGDVNDQQLQAGDLQAAFIKGDPVDIHDVMIASEKAKTTFQLLMEIRNKGLDLYREAMRVQA